MILDAGRWAPSGTNRQPWEFIVIKNREIMRQIYKNTKKFATMQSNQAFKIPIDIE